MKSNRIKIDGLILFYVLSLGVLGLLWKYGIVILSEVCFMEFQQTFDFDKKTKVSVGKRGEIEKISVLNPDLSIYYSLNGQDSFQKSGQVLDFDEMYNPNISNVPSSIRWMPEIGHHQQLKSVSAFLVNHHTGERSNVRCMTSSTGMDADLPIASLVISEKELFDPSNGLMVQGKHAWVNPDFQEPWWFRDANYTQRGADWEKRANLQYFEDGQLQFEQVCGIRISGNASRGFPQKSLRILARQSYGSNKLAYKFFGAAGKKKYKSMVIRSSGNDNGSTMFADLLMHNLAQGAHLLTQKGSPILLYINGNYWGVYNLREHIDENFIANYEGKKKKNVVILENGTASLKNDAEKKQNHFLALIDELNNLNEVSDERYEECSKVIDILSLMDYIFFETYYANNDWPENNSICYKVKGEKWKWVLNDLDFSLGYPGPENVNLNMFERIKYSTSVPAILFHKLLTNRGFEEGFKRRCHWNLQEYLSSEAIKRNYKRLKQLYQKEMPSQISRWRNIHSMQKWESNCQKNLDFLLNRREIYTRQLEAL